MTPRSDSEQIRAARGEKQASVVYFFVGTKQPPLGADPTSPPPGTIEGTALSTGRLLDDRTVLVRGQRRDGAWRSDDVLMDTLIHEASHALHHSYHGADATDLARYKNEFQASSQSSSTRSRRSTIRTSVPRR